MATRHTISPGGFLHPVLDQFRISEDFPERRLSVLTIQVWTVLRLDSPYSLTIVLIGCRSRIRRLLCGQRIDDRTPHIAAFIGAKRAASARAMFDRIRNNPSAQILYKGCLAVSQQSPAAGPVDCRRQNSPARYTDRAASQLSEIFSASFTSADALIHKFSCTETSFNDKICCVLNWRRQSEPARS